MSSKVKKVLGVMSEGGPLDGSHFNQLFDKVYKVINTADDVTENVGAVLFWGGTDISATLYKRKANSYNQGPSLPSKRDLVEWETMQRCIEKDIPMIGVCRGAQLLCVFAGGELYQHVPQHLSSNHPVTCRGIDYFNVRADHHQMMCPPPEAVVLGWSTNKIASGYYDENNMYTSFPVGFKEPEIVFFPDIKALGIQPHPEWMVETNPFVTLCLNLCKEKLCL